MITTTTATAAVDQILDEFQIFDVASLMGHESTSAARYVTDLYGDASIAVHCAHTWACLADLAQWGAFRRHEPVTREIAWTLHWSAWNYSLDESARMAQRFDY